MMTTQQNPTPIQTSFSNAILWLSLILLCAPSFGAQPTLFDPLNPNLVSNTLKQSRQSLYSDSASKLSHNKIGRFLKSALVNTKGNVSTPFIRFKQDDNVQVYVKVVQANSTTLAKLSEAGLTVELFDEETNKIQGWVATDQIEPLAELTEVQRITVPSYARAYAGSVTTQGDSILLSSRVQHERTSTSVLWVSQLFIQE